MTQRRAVTRQNTPQSRDVEAEAAQGRKRVNKYGAKAVCACGHPREYHAMWSSAASAGNAIESHCLDVHCGCRAYQHRYDSMAEAARGGELEAMERAGLIANLRRQVPYELSVGGWHIARYVADFEYEDAKTGQTVTEDVKGHRTREYRIKARLLWALYGIELREIEA